MTPEEFAGKVKVALNMDSQSKAALNMADLKRWHAEEESRWKALAGRESRYPSLEQATAYYYGRMMVFRELMAFLETQ